MKASSFKPFILYAVGNVILILAGVLVSFSLNNSNDFWVKRLQEQQIAVRISGGFNAGISRTSNSQDGLRYKKDALRSLGPFARGKFIDDKRSFLEGVILASTFGRGHPPLVQTTFRKLLNSGQLGLILDTELRLQLAPFLPLRNPKRGAIQSANGSIS